MQSPPESLPPAAEATPAPKLALPRSKPAPKIYLPEDYLDVDLEEAAQFARLQYGMKDLALLMGITQTHLRGALKANGHVPNRWLKKHQMRGQAELREKQWEAALAGNLMMLALLCTNHLDQSFEAMEEVFQRMAQMGLLPKADASLSAGKEPIPIEEEHDAPDSYSYDESAASAADAADEAMREATAQMEALERQKRDEADARRGILKYEDLTPELIQRINAKFGGKQQFRSRFEGVEGYGPPFGKPYPDCLYIRMPDSSIAQVPNPDYVGEAMAAA